MKKLSLFNKLSFFIKSKLSIIIVIFVMSILSIIMTTLTINIPDDSSDVISDITSLVKSAGGEISVSVEEGLSEEEMELLKASYKEALLIRDGKLKSIPASELWND